MAWATVAVGGTNAVSGAASCALAIGTVSVGHRVTVVVNVNAWPAGGTPVTVMTDNLGNTWVEDDFVAFTDSGVACRGSVFSSTITTGGSCTVTVWGNAGHTSTWSFGMSSQGYSGLSTTSGSGAIDQKQSRSGVGGTASSNATAATTAANELAVGGYTDDGQSVALTGNNGSGWTQRRAQGGVSTAESYLEDQDTGASGATPNASLASGIPGGSSITWSMHTVVYKLAGGGATTAYRDATARIRVAATAFRDATARVRVAVRAFRDATARVRVAATAFRDSTVRIVVTTPGATTAYKFATARIRVAATAFKDSTVRVGVRVQAYRDATARVRVVAPGYRDATTRIRTAVRAFKDATLRVGVRVGAFKDAALRVRVVVRGYRDASLRIGVDSGIPFRDMVYLAGPPTSAWQFGNPTTGWRFGNPASAWAIDVPEE